MNSFNYWSLGIAFWYSRRFKEAIHQLQHAILLDPKSFLYYHDLGMFLRQNGQIQEAITTLQKALKHFEADEFEWVLFFRVDDQGEFAGCAELVLLLSGRGETQFGKEFV